MMAAVIFIQNRGALPVQHITEDPTVTNEQFLHRLTSSQKQMLNGLSNLSVPLPSHAAKQCRKQAGQCDLHPVWGQCCNLDELSRRQITIHAFRAPQITCTHTGKMTLTPLPEWGHSKVPQYKNTYRLLARRVSACSPSMFIDLMTSHEDCQCTSTT